MILNCEKDMSETSSHMLKFDSEHTTYYDFEVVLLKIAFCVKVMLLQNAVVKHQLTGWYTWYVWFRICRNYYAHILINVRCIVLCFSSFLTTDFLTPQRCSSREKEQFLSKRNYKFFY